MISGITLVSSNDNGSWAKSGDNLTLDFTTSEVVQRPSVMLAGSSLHADNTSHSGKQWRLVYPVQSGDNGTVDLDFGVKDLAGNVSDNVTQDNASLITIDNSLPVIGNIVFVSNNAKSSSYARIGDNLTFSFETNESLKDASVTLNNKISLTSQAKFTGIDLVSNNWNWVVDYQVDDNSTKWGVNEDGAVAEYELSVSDYAGNLRTSSYVLGQQINNITVDIKTPQISNVSLSLDKTYPVAKAQDSVKLEFDVSDSSDPFFVVINGIEQTETAGTKDWLVNYTIPEHRSEVSTVSFTGNSQFNSGSPIGIAWTLMVPISFLILRSMSFTESRGDNVSIIAGTYGSSGIPSTGKLNGPSGLRLILMEMFSLRIRTTTG